MSCLVAAIFNSGFSGHLKESRRARDRTGTPSLLLPPRPCRINGGDGFTSIQMISSAIDASLRDGDGDSGGTVGVAGEDSCIWFVAVLGSDGRD